MYKHCINTLYKFSVSLRDGPKTATNDGGGGMCLGAAEHSDIDFLDTAHKMLVTGIFKPTCLKNS